MVNDCIINHDLIFVMCHLQAVDVEMSLKNVQAFFDYWISHPGIIHVCKTEQMSRSSMSCCVSLHRCLTVLVS